MLYEHELVRKGLACWYKGRLIPVIRGGDGRDEPLFADIPAKLEEIDDAELISLAESLRARVKEVFAGKEDPDIVGERTRSQVAEEMQKAVLSIESIDAELTARAADAEQYDETLSTLASRAGVEHTEEPETGEGENAEGETADDAGKGEDEATTAAGEAQPEKPAPPAVRPLPRAAARHRPVQSDDDGSGLRVTSHAAGLGAPYDAMTVLNREDLGDFLNDIVRRNRIQPGQKAVLAHASYPFPEDRILAGGPDGYEINSQKIRAVVPSALTASGANCAPLPPIYELPGVETPARPVRGANPSFQASRGGVQVGVTPTMGVYADAVGVVTAAENAAGGTSAVKGCMRIECPEFSPTSVDSIYQCIEADNLAARSYPELMARIADLVMAEQARLADSKLLTAIKAGSTNVTSGGIDPGAIYQFLGAVYAAAAGIRSRNRMPADARLVALIPAWAIDLFALDFGRAANADNRPTTRAAIENYLGQLGINATFYLDGPSTGTGQIFAAQTAGALLDFPPDLQWALYPTGSWLNLDAGELQLGVVRDSSLNATNDFQIFAETWENIVFTGVESLWLTSEVCPNGAFGAASDVAGICGT
jgi:hypothetical protein